MEEEEDAITDDQDVIDIPAETSSDQDQPASSEAGL